VQVTNAIQLLTNVKLSFLIAMTVMLAPKILSILILDVFTPQNVWHKIFASHLVTRKPDLALLPLKIVMTVIFVLQTVAISALELVSIPFSRALAELETLELAILKPQSV
jgi:hypothetical protein